MPSVFQVDAQFFANCFARSLSYIKCVKPDLYYITLISHIKVTKRVILSFIFGNASLSLMSEYPSTFSKYLVI